MIVSVRNQFQLFLSIYVAANLISSTITLLKLLALLRAEGTIPIPLVDPGFLQMKTVKSQKFRLGQFYTLDPFRLCHSLAFHLAPPLISQYFLDTEHTQSSVGLLEIFVPPLI